MPLHVIFVIVSQYSFITLLYYEIMLCYVILSYVSVAISVGMVCISEHHSSSLPLFPGTRCVRFVWPLCVVCVLKWKAQ